MYFMLRKIKFATEEVETSLLFDWQLYPTTI